MSRSIIVVFEVVGEITNAQSIAIGRKIRQLDRLKKLYGPAIGGR